MTAKVARRGTAKRDVTPARSPGPGAKRRTPTNHRRKLRESDAHNTRCKPDAALHALGLQPEIDVSQLVRPELFHNREVSGIAIPVRELVGNRPVGRWVQFLRWHGDGRREVRPLSESLALPNGSRLWFSQTPQPPQATTRSEWSEPARREWQRGKAAADPVDLFNRIRGQISYFLDFPPEMAHGHVATLALYVMLTYIYPAWSAVPYLSIGGPVGAGKSTVFRVLSRMVFRPLESSNMTAPCLFRTLHERGGTLLLDEAERLQERTADVTEIRSILLSGYKAGSPARRLEKTGDTFMPHEYEVFGPKAIAGVEHLTEALASRCIRITMFRALAGSSKPRRRIDDNLEVFTDIRDDLHAIALEHGPVWIDLADRPGVCPSQIEGRYFELFQPLLALAHWLEKQGAAGLLRLMQEHALKVIETSRDDVTPDAEETLLRHLARHVSQGTHVTLKPINLLKEVRRVDDVTFRTWSPKRVGAALQRYGLRTRKQTGSVGRTYSDVTLENLRSIESAYRMDLGVLPADAPQVPHVPQKQ